MNGKCPTPRAQKSGKSPTLSPGVPSGIHLILPLQLKVSLLEGCEISESEQNLGLNEKNRSLYTITCYRTTNNILIQGICRHFWVESELPKFKRIIDQFHDDDLSLTELYNVQFERELVKGSNLEFSEGDTDFEQEENPTSEAVEDLLLDKVDLCNVHNMQPKTKIKRLNLNKKTPLKSRTKTSSLKSSKTSAFQGDRKSSSSLEILTDKIDSFEVILLRLDQSISDTNILFLESKAELISFVNNSLVEFKVDVQSYVDAEVAKKTLTLDQILQLENENKILRESIDKIKDDCEKEINETINVKCEEGLKNLTNSVRLN